MRRAWRGRQAEQLRPSTGPSSCARSNRRAGRHTGGLRRAITIAFREWQMAAGEVCATTQTVSRNR